MGGIFDRVTWTDGPQFENWLADPDAPAIATRHICYGGGKVGGGGGGTTTQTSTVNIPPEVLANYNTAWNQATTAAQQPFTPYPGEMVAPVNPVQSTGIAQTLGQIGQSQPYFDAATNSLIGGTAAALPYYDAAGNLTANGVNALSDFTGAATGALGAANAGAQPYNQAAAGNLNFAQGQGQTMAQQALQTLYGGANAAQPLNASALNTLGQAQNNPFLGQSANTLNTLATNQGQPTNYSNIGQGFDLSGLMQALASQPGGGGGGGTGPQVNVPQFNLGSLAGAGSAPINFNGIAQASQPVTPQITTPMLDFSAVANAGAGWTPPPLTTTVPQVGPVAPGQPQTQPTMPAGGGVSGGQYQPPPGASGTPAMPGQSDITNWQNAIPTQSNLNFGDIGSSFDPTAFMHGLNFDLGAAPDANMTQAAYSLQSGIDAAATPQQQVGQQIQQALQGASGYNSTAGQQLQNALNYSQGYNNAAGQGIESALAAGSPLQAESAALARAGSQAVTPTAFSQDALQQYMSPYTQSVVEATMKQLQQQQAMEQQSLIGNQIARGAFGGDRGNISRAMLANQQDMASGSILSNLYNQNYTQALGAFQNQQGVDLQTGLANRQAQLAASGQLGTLGQQGFAQQLAGAQAQAGLGQQIFGQQLGSGQALGALGQQIYGQEMGAGAANAALGQQLFGQGLGASQQQAALQQNTFGQWAQQQQLQQQAAANKGQLGLGAAQTAQQGQIAQGQLQLGQEELAQQGKIAQGQIGLGGQQIAANKEVALLNAATAQQGVAIQSQALQQQGQLAMAQMQFQQQQLQQQGAIAAGQLGLSQSQLMQQGQIAAGQLGIQAGQLSQQGQIALGQLSLGQQSLSQQGALGFGQLGVQQQLGLGQLGLGQAGLGLQQQGLQQQGLIAAGQLGLGQAGLQQQGQIAGAQLGQQQQNNLFNQGLNLAQQQAALGQQAFGQGATSAQIQAALAQQIYGQGLGTAGLTQDIGQSLYGQGANAAQQQAALGQQVFGQGATTAGLLGSLGQQLGTGQMAAGQQQAALGQSLYGMGSNTANQLAGIGTGQQQANLGLAQSIIGAGTVQQQTQQAADQAYYNQFLQQQGYPFQLAQFLSNIATSQGALSGSTTTAQTTQPGSLFSDKDLKQDAEVIGKTFDGQPVYRFAYKDDPGTTHVGLMAQDVEKRHPSAVGESDGYKTVNYDEATRAAADRGHFALGGIPQLDPANFSSPQAMAWAQKINGGAGKGGIPGGGSGKGGVPGGGVPAPGGLQIGGHGVALPPDFGGTPAPSNRATNPFGAALLGLAQHGALPGQLAATRSGSSNPTGALSAAQIQDLIAGGAKDTKPPAPPPPAPKEEKAPEVVSPAPASSLFGGDDPSMDAWRRSMMNMPQGFTGSTAARGGAITPEMAGAGFADGGSMGGDYLQQLLAQILSKGAPQYGGAGLYGKPIGGSGPYGVPSGGGAAPRSLTPARLPEIPRQGPSTVESGMSAINQAMQTAQNVQKLGSMAKEGLVGAPGKPGQPGTETSGLFGSSGRWDDMLDMFRSGPAELPLDYLENNPLARGGRAGYASGGLLPYGQTEDEYIPDDLTRQRDPAELLSEQKSMAAPLPAIHNEGSRGGGGGFLNDLGSVVGIATKVLPFFLKSGGRVGYEEGGYVADENDPVQRLLEQLRASQPDIPPLPPGPKEIPLELAKDRLPGMDRYERMQEPKGGTAPPTEPVGMPPIYPHIPMPESGTRGPSEGALPAPQSITVPAMPPLENRTVKSAPTLASNEPSDIFDRMLGIESGNRQFDEKGNVVKSRTGATGIAQVQPETGPEAAKLADLPWDPHRFENDADYNKALGKAYHDKQTADFGDPYIGAAAYNAGPGAVRAALAKAQAQGGNYLNYLPKETQDYVAKLQGGTSPSGGRSMALNQVPSVPTSPQDFVKPVDATATAATPPVPDQPPKKDEPNWFDRNERLIASILTGLGGAAAMGMNPRANIAGVALAGLGAGAAQYAQMGRSEREMNIQERGLDIQQQAKQLEAAKYLRDTVIPRVDPITGQTYYVNKATGQRMTEAQVGDLFKGVLGGKGFNLQPPGAAPPSGGALPAAPTSQVPGVQTAAPKSDNIVQQQTNPEFLFSEAKKYTAASNKAYEQGDIEGANRFQKMADEYTNRAKALTGAEEAGKKAALAPVELAQTTATENMKTQMKARDEARIEAQNAANTVQQAQASLNLMFDPKTGQPTISGGPIGEKLTTLSAFLKQMGYSDEFVKGFTGTDPANAQALEKLRTTMSTEIARQELAGSPVRVTEFNRFLETTPSAALIPEAFRWIVNNNILPKAQTQMKAYEAIAGLDPSKDDIQRRLYEFGRDNPWYRPPAGAVTAQPERKEETPQATPKITEGTTATNPQTGQRIVFRNGKWGPI